MDIEVHVEFVEVPFNSKVASCMERYQPHKIGWQLGGTALLQTTAGGVALECYLPYPTPPLPFRQSSGPLPSHDGDCSVWGNPYSWVSVSSLSHLFNKMWYHLACFSGYKTRACSKINVSHTHITSMHECEPPCTERFPS